MPAALLLGASLLLAGCRPQAPSDSEVTGAPEASRSVDDDAQGAAEASLGKQAEILARGDLARNGTEQLLVVNRLSVPGAKASTADAKSAPIPVTRAVVLEKSNGKWSEILRCDEHLKNTNGYLGGLPSLRVDVWMLQYRQDTKGGLEMQFRSALIGDAVNIHTGEPQEVGGPVFDVRWNNKTKRYQSYDQSHERYLGEVPSLEIPQSHLK